MILNQYSTVREFAKKSVELTRGLMREFKDFKESPKETSRQLFKKTIGILLKKNEESKDDDNVIDKASYAYRIKVIMPDGSIDEYPKGFIITDKINCIECNGKLYHTSFYCPDLEDESDGYTLPIKGLKIKEAKKRKMGYCYYCKQDLHDTLTYGYYQDDYMNDYDDEVERE